MVHEQVEQIFSDILSNRQASNFIALLRDKFITDMEKEPENLSDEQIRYLVLARNYNRINIRVAEYNLTIFISPMLMVVPTTILLVMLELKGYVR